MDFLVRCAVSGEEASDWMRAHMSLVRNLRTLMQHNLNPELEHDKSVHDACQLWLERQCGTPVPDSEQHWDSCLLRFLEECLRFLDGLKKTVRGVEVDEMKEQRLDEWNYALSRRRQPQEFDELISRVANDMGRNDIDAVRLRKRHYDRWTAELRLLTADHDWRTEARRLVEHVLLSETTPVLSITGNDIIEGVSVAAGPRIGGVAAGGTHAGRPGLQV